MKVRLALNVFLCMHLMHTQDKIDKSTNCRACSMERKNCELLKWMNLNNSLAIAVSSHTHYNNYEPCLPDDLKFKGGVKMPYSNHCVHWLIMMSSSSSSSSPSSLWQILFWKWKLLLVLHDNQLTHTDLKPENILFVNSDSESIYNVKRVSQYLVLWPAYVQELQ